MVGINSAVLGTASETYAKQSAKTGKTPAERYSSEKLEMQSFNIYSDENDTVFISEESKKMLEEFIQNKQKKEFSVTESGDIMENGLILNIDPHGEIEKTAYFEELAKHLNNLADKTDEEKMNIDKAVAEAVKNRMAQAKQDFIAKLIADGYTQVNNIL